jgi:hypothetical protein
MHNAKNIFLYALAIIVIALIVADSFFLSNQAANANAAWTRIGHGHRYSNSNEKLNSPMKWVLLLAQPRPYRYPL